MAKNANSPPAALESACSCGNTDVRNGFYFCDTEGRRVKAGGLRCCDRCGKITDAATGKLIGHRSFALVSVDALEK